MDLSKIEERLDRYREEHSDLKEKIAERVTELKVKVDNNQLDVDKLKKDVSGAHHKIRDLEEVKRDYQDKMKEIEKSHSNLKDSIDNQISLLNKRVAQEKTERENDFKQVEVVLNEYRFWNRIAGWFTKMSKTTIAIIVAVVAFLFNTVVDMQGILAQIAGK